MSTSLGRICSRLVLILACMLSSKPLLAKTVIFTDIQGYPIFNVVVADSVNEAYKLMRLPL